MSAALSDVQALLAGWWFDYDQGNFEVWNEYFTGDAHFSCRSDSQSTAFEEFVTADVSGREAVVAWNTEHRNQSPYPLRHNGTNIHLIANEGNECSFRSYIFVTQIVGGGVAPLASGICVGAARFEESRWRLSELRLMLDFTDSATFSSTPHFTFH